MVNDSILHFILAPRVPPASLPTQNHSHGVQQSSASDCDFQFLQSEAKTNSQLFKICWFFSAFDKLWKSILLNWPSIFFNLQPKSFSQSIFYKFLFRISNWNKQTLIVADNRMYYTSIQCRHISVGRPAINRFQTLASFNDWPTGIYHSHQPGSTRMWNHIRKNLETFQTGSSPNE